MKSLPLGIVAILAIIFAAVLPLQAESKAKVETRTVIFKMTGMSWAGGCPPAVSRIFKAQKGVKTVAIDFKTKLVTVEVEKKTSSDKELIAAFAKSRFKAAVHIPKAKKG